MIIGKENKTMKQNEFRTLKADEIKVRVGNVSQKGASLLLYTEARTVMDILDETVGPENWESDYKEVKGVVYGGIGVRSENGWTWKWDCGTESFSEAAKGESSDAFKRAAVKWQIARELYKGPKVFVEAATNQKDGKYYLADSEKNKLQFGTYVKEISYDENRNITKLIVEANYYDKASGTYKTDVIYSFPRTSRTSRPAPAPVQSAPPQKEQQSVKPTAKISKGCADYLTQLISKTNTDKVVLLNYYKVNAVEELTTTDYENCVKILEQKLAS